MRSMMPGLPSRISRPDGLRFHFSGGEPPSLVAGLALGRWAVTARLSEVGRVILAILDSGVISPWTLLRGGFLPSERRVQCTIDGPRPLLKDPSLRGPLHFGRV